MRKIAVIGGGAAGIMAAIQAKEYGADVIIYEHMRPGKKILSTGNGRCNLGNLYLNRDCYFSHHMDRVEECLTRFGTKETMDFFEKIGLCMKDRNGYLYPLSDQASVVLDVLINKLRRLDIPVITDEKVNKILPGKKITLQTDKGKRIYDGVILACGSKAAPKTGSDGSGFEFAKSLGHKLIPVLPALVQLQCKDSFCKELAGIRCDCKIHIFHEKKELCVEEGELQLTDYGISGIPVFQLSGLVNRYMYHNKDAQLTAKINFMPHISEKEYEKIIPYRMNELQDCTVEEFFTGMLNQKLMKVLIKQAGLRSDLPMKKTSKKQIDTVFSYCREFEMHIVGSKGFENAQVCTGGVDLGEVTSDLESVYVPNVYFAGELLDVDGRCGGYNLQWAWTSGTIAGRAAAKQTK